MTLIEIVNERSAINADVSVRQKDFMTWLERQRRRLAQLAHDESLLSSGVDADRMTRGLAVVYIHGDYSKPVSGRGYSEKDSRSKIVDDAKCDLASGGRRLLTEAFGVKNYDGFGDQRSDHPYGMGPRHGSIVFSIGLTTEARKESLTFAQIEDALYVLVNISHLNAARERSAA